MKKIALIIGHSKRNQGARNKTYDTTEFQFNEPLAHSVAEKLILEGCEPVIIYRDCSYSQLPEKVNKTGANVAISFHCNAFNKHPNGSEVLYFKNSVQGKLLAQSIQTEFVKCLGLKDRGLRPCVASHVGKAGDRGGWLLERTEMTCVIAEPFFIDSDKSLALAHSKFEELAEAYTQGIVSYLRGQHGN